jgi:hypothetical protein
VQAPFTGAVTATDVALTDEGADAGGALAVEAPALRTVTHEPTVTSAAVAFPVSVKAVVAPYVTATCALPVWTCRVLPDSAATRPETPGGA